MDGLSGCVPQDYSMRGLSLFIGSDDPLLTRAMICFVFILLAKYKNFAVFVRNVGCLNGSDHLHQNLPDRHLPTHPFGLWVTVQSTGSVFTSLDGYKPRYSPTMRGNRPPSTPPKKYNFRGDDTPGK